MAFIFIKQDMHKMLTGESDSTLSTRENVVMTSEALQQQLCRQIIL